VISPQEIGERETFCDPPWIIVVLLACDDHSGMHPGGRADRAPARYRLLTQGKSMTLHHPIFTRWLARYPDRLQLFSLPTPNGVKVGIMLEETGLAYEAHRLEVMANEHHDPAFLALNPNGKSCSNRERS
jgi:hypothetical protein